MSFNVSLTKRLPWLSLFLLLLLPFFFVGGPGAYTPPVVSIAWDFGHYLFFSLLAWLGFRSGFIHSYKRWFIALAIVAVIGALIEIIQSKVGRDGNWGDLGRDIAGFALGGIFAPTSIKWLRWTLVPGLIVIAPNIEELGFVAGATIRAHQVFPSIQGGYETVWDLYPGRPHLARVENHATEGRFALEVKLSIAQYSGANIRPLKRDWRGYQRLKFDIKNPDQTPLSLVIRINDVTHDLGDNDITDRFNERLLVEPGVNHYDIALADIEKAPKDRKMKMDEINSMMLFATKLPAARKIYIDNVRLTND